MENKDAYDVCKSVYVSVVKWLHLVVGVLLQDC